MHNVHTFLIYLLASYVLLQFYKIMYSGLVQFMLGIDWVSDQHLTLIESQ